MNRSVFIPVWFAICLILPAPPSIGQTQKRNAPSILAIASGKVVNISPDGIREIAGLSGHILFGSDAETAAFLQTPANGPHGGSRLLIIDRKTSVIIKDIVVQGLHPMITKATFAHWLAVCSRDSAVYLPQFGTNLFSVGEANWATGASRTLDPAVAEGSERYEITALYLVPSGIAVGRGPFLAIFNPAAHSPLLALQSPGPRWQPTGGYYPVPGFGLVESTKQGMFSRVTEKDFTTLIPNPAGFPNLETNRVKPSWRLGWIIKGKPCLLWDENEDELQPQNQTISRIAIFDLESKSIMLRKSLGGDFSGGFLPDTEGQRIYFSDLYRKEIYCLDLTTQDLRSFAKFGPGGFDSWVAAN